MSALKQLREFRALRLKMHAACDAVYNLLDGHERPSDLKRREPWNHELALWEQTIRDVHEWMGANGYGSYSITDLDSSLWDRAYKQTGGRFKDALHI